TYTVMAALIGVYRGDLYNVSGNLLLVIIAHALYDFVPLVYLQCRGSPPEDTHKWPGRRLGLGGSTMPLFTCPQGPQLQPADFNPSLTDTAPCVCPVCGAAPQTLHPPEPGAEDRNDPDVHSPATQVTLPPLGPGLASPGAKLPAVPGYDVLAVLGHGGMSVGYKASQVRLDRLVALKLISTGRHAGAPARARFRA